MKSRFLCVTPGMEGFFYDLLQAAKKIGYMLSRWGVRVFLDCECVEFVTAG